MRTDRLSPRARPSLLLVAVLALAPCVASEARAALCGDTSGDGFVTASDALRTLKLAVAPGYDRRGDLAPAPPPGQRTGAGDGKIVASDALAGLRAAVEARIPPCHGATATRAVVTTAPFNFEVVGGIAVVDLAPPFAFDFRGGATSPDAVVRVQGGGPVVVNRQNFNSLQWIDTGAEGLPSLNECSVRGGINSNPQDVVIVSGSKGYVTPHSSSSLYVIDPRVLFEPDRDPSCQTLITAKIDLSAWDSDAVPQVDQMALVGDELFVTVQRLWDKCGLVPRCAPQEAQCLANEPGDGDSCDRGLVLVLDTKTDEVVASIPLAFANPFGETKGIPYDEFRGLLYVGGPGTTGSILDDGGLEAVDPATRASAGVMLGGADLGADLYDFVVAGSDRLFAIVADQSSNRVVEIDLSERKVTRTLWSSTFLITDLEMTETGELWVACRGETDEDPAGLRVFRVTDGAQLTEGEAPIALGQAPFTLAFD